MIYGFTPTHPGEVLKDEIEARGMQQKMLAESMGMSYKALDIPATTLLQLQMKYNYQQAKNNPTFVRKLEVIRKAVASIVL